MLMTIALVALTSCTSNPTAGTETGNPDITACLKTALETFDTLDDWLPSTYLTGGEQLLNPQRLVDEFNHSTVAKKLADSDTVDTSVVRVYVIERKDTTYQRDTQYVRDTLLLDTLIIDSSRQVMEDDSDKSILSASFIRHDTVFIFDTVYAIDTIIRIQYDTVTEKGAASVPDVAVDSRSEYVILKSDTMQYSVKRNGENGELIIVQNDSSTQVSAPVTQLITSEIRSGESFLNVSRVSSTPAMTISESYTYTASVPLPGTGYQTEAATSLLSHGSISYTDGGSTTVLQIDFDAGKDQSFPTTSDNRISALLRTTETGTGITDRISYGERYFGSLTDTIVLQRDRQFMNGTISRETNRYNCLHGMEDVTDHRYNRLAGCRRQIYFSNNAIRSLSLVITLQQPLMMGASPETADVAGIIDFGKGLSGIINGVADFRTKVLYGTYAQAGTEYRFSYVLSDTAAVLTRVE